MIDHIWTVVCSKSIIDHQSNNITLFNVLEQISVTLPVEKGKEKHILIPLSFEVVSFWTRKEEHKADRGTARLSFITPSGNVSSTYEYEIDLSEYIRTRMIVGTAGLEFQESGIHYFHVELQCDGDDKWQSVARIPLQILIEPPAKN